MVLEKFPGKFAGKFCSLKSSVNFPTKFPANPKVFFSTKFSAKIPVHPEESSEKILREADPVQFKVKFLCTV